MTTIEHWKELAQSKLPAEDFITKRNRQITAQYATLYSNHSRYLKWAGMACFASHKVGLALTPFQLYENEYGCLEMHGEDYGRIGEDLNIIRYTNNKVYEDIAWAHFVYTSDDGGIELLRALLKNDADHRMLLEGFEHIEAGRQILETDGDKKQGEQEIWLGNSLLLKHEQMYTVQPMFKKFDFAFKRFLSISTAMDFDLRNLHFDPRTYTSFYLYMWLLAPHMLVKTFSLPSITKFEHRWHWINKRMLPIWKRVDFKDRHLKEKLAKILEYAASPAGTITK